MKPFILPFLLFVVTFTATVAGAIRDFPIPTIVALGKELHLRDQMAAAAFDALLAGHPEAAKVPIRGWITEADKEHRRVYFIQEVEAKYSLAYIATFHEKDEPQIEEKHGAALPEDVARRFAARRAAIAAIPKFMTKNYNYEVLDAPDGNGFLVYGLASTTDPNEIIVGGHYRISVSAEGKVRQVDALSRSFLVLPRHAADTPKDAEVEAMLVTHIVSATPVETHVFVSLLYKTPLVVATTEHDLWSVKDGEITKMEEEKAAEEKP